MNGVLIDNWNLQEIYYDIYDINNIHDIHEINNKNYSQPYKDLLSAIVLWENIFYPQNERSVVWNPSNSILSKIMQPYDDSKHIFSEQAAKIYHNICNCDETNAIIGQGAIRYQLLSNSLGLNYLPAPKRADFLKKYNYSSSILRSQIENIVDSSVMNMFLQLNSLLGEEQISFKMPLLVDYIIYNTNNSSSHIDCAMELKKDNSVKRYRQYLSYVEKELEKGNWTELFSFKRDTEELINDILKLDNKHIFSTNVSLSIMPSICVEKEFNIKKPKLHLTFIKSLIDFAFKKRKQ